MPNANNDLNSAAPANVILTINAGSSSIKFALFACTGNATPLAQQAILSGQVDGIGGQTRFTAKNSLGKSIADLEPGHAADENAHQAALQFLLDWLTDHDDGARIVAVGHRVVHGGERYAEPVQLNAALIDALADFIPLAPLHQPHNLGAIRSIARLRPELPQVACFDTAFHRSQPPLAQLFALPRAITSQGVRRYGFHGLSYEFIAKTLPEHLGAGADGRIVVAHLGNGASMCAIHHRRSIATTMGFTAVEGLVMGTRCGSLDPGVLLYLMEYAGYDAAALTRLLYKESGLLGVSGLSADMRVLLGADSPEAREAVDLFCYRIVREIGSLAAALGGLDALVFTGGIGEHAAPVREKICSNSAWLGIDLDAAANAGHSLRISTAASRVAVLVMPTNEEWIIARHTAEILRRQIL
jgi:acetate kinase